MNERFSYQQIKNALIHYVINDREIELERDYRALQSIGLVIDRETLTPKGELYLHYLVQER